MNTPTDLESTRRDLLRLGVSVAGASLMGASAMAAQPAARCSTAEQVARPGEPRAQGDGQEEEVSPAEDLMREHAVLTRMLLIYGEAAQRLESAARDLSPEPLAQSAELVRAFVEDYHEKLEEQYLFPRFKQAKVLVDLVETLQAQHDAGRRLTDVIIRMSTLTAFKYDAQRSELIKSLRQFIRMYLPHEAREDTVLFPAFRKLVSGNEYDSLGEDFEKKEHELFGAGGFEAIVDKVAGIEKQLGLYDLAQFTPKL